MFRIIKLLFHNRRSSENLPSLCCCARLALEKMAFLMNWEIIEGVIIYRKGSATPILIPKYIFRTIPRSTTDCIALFLFEKL